MARRSVLKFPDPRLKQVAEPVQDITPAITDLVEDMLDTMYGEPGIGLAATQLGEPVRVIVLDILWLNPNTPRNPSVLINPRIVAVNGTLTKNLESCLSVPNYEAEVERHPWVEVSGLDLDGREYRVVDVGLGAACLQHELDHLNGILFIDRISRLKRQMYTKKLQKASRRQHE